MENLDTQLTTEMVALIPVITAALQAIKKIPIVAKITDYMPFVSIALSIGAVYTLTNEIQVIPAVIMGLTASGLYSGVKAISSK
jgi:hypothetical protein